MYTSTLSVTGNGSKRNNLVIENFAVCEQLPVTDGSIRAGFPFFQAFPASLIDPGLLCEGHQSRLWDSHLSSNCVEFQEERPTSTGVLAR